MNPLEVIAKKQAGLELGTEEIAGIIEGYTLGSVPDYQMSALLMAIYFRGMNRRETVDLTRAMIASGRKANFDTLKDRKVDKHSTGGVGDKVSLIVAPIVASLGVPVPMISGRGLVHTGGTLDKLESIPGFSTALTIEEFVQQVKEIGCALIGQSQEIVPADQKLYALRDVTCTVRSIPLVAGSILSKKIAEGAEALLLDVKFGRGAFFPEQSQARELALTLVAIGEELGLEVRALLTDMNQPLGRAVGNWLEVWECLQVMTGQGDTPDLLELSLAEAALMLMLAGHAPDYTSAQKTASQALESGAAHKKFFEIVRRQKGDARFVEDPSGYPEASCIRTLSSEISGQVQELDARAVGRAAVELGAGRKHRDDDIDYSAGIILHKKRGDEVEQGESLATLYSSSDDKIEGVIPTIRNAYKIGKEPPKSKPLIVSEISNGGESPWTY